MSDLEEHLNTKSKEELIKILTRLIKNDKELDFFIDDRTDNIPVLIKKLKFDECDLTDFIKRMRKLHELITSTKEQLQNLLELFYKLLKIMNTYDQSDLLDNLAIKIIKNINKEMKKLTKEQEKQIIKEIKSKSGYQDFLLDLLE